MPTYAEEVAADAPLVYFRLGETSGLTAFDASGNGRNGTYNGTPGQGANSLLPGDTNDKALTFSGDEWVEISSASWMDVTTFSIECWFNLTSATDATNGDTLVSRWDTGGYPWLLYRNVSGQLAFSFRNSAGTLYTRTGPSVTLGATYHVVATVTETHLFLYVNGVEWSVGSYANGIQVSTSPIVIGRSAQNSGTIPSGVIDEVAFYSPPLSDTRILAHYNAGATGPAYPVNDTFTRADTSSPLGTADTGQAWAALSGPWGISNNKAYMSNGGQQAYAIVESTLSNCTISVTLSGNVSVGGGITFRALDSTHLWFTESDGGTSYLYKCDGGGPVLVANMTTGWVAGDVMTVVLNGDSIIVKKNNVQVFSRTDSLFSTYTKHGLRDFSGVARFDDFSITETAVPTATGSSSVNVGSSNRVVKTGTPVATVINGGAEAHIGPYVAGSFTLSSNVEVTGCTIYTTPFDGGIPAGTLIGISTNLAGLTTIPWVVNGVLANTVAQGGNAATVEFQTPVMLTAGTIYCITGDTDLLVANGTTTSGLIATNRNWLGGHPFVADTGAYRVPFQLSGTPVPITGISPTNAGSSSRASVGTVSLTGTSPVNAGTSSRVSGAVASTVTGISPVSAGSSSRMSPILTTKGSAPETSSSTSAPITALTATSTSAVTSETSNVVDLLSVDLTGLSPVSVGSSSNVYSLENLEGYPGEESSTLVPFELSGIMDPIFPAPIPPVDFAGLPDPTTAPTLVKATAANGHLTPGTYRYSYAAWKGNPAQATAPSPFATVTLTTENRVTVTYPKITGADGYLVYREDL